MGREFDQQRVHAWLVQKSSGSENVPTPCSERAYGNEIACTEYAGTLIVVVKLVPDCENEIGVVLICDPFTIW
jgi:hypothetical protein